MLDDLDYQIVDALQMHPRIAWADLGRILAADPSTLSRRWSRLTDEGLAWSSCFRRAPAGMRDGATALVHVGCAPGRRENVINQLADEPAVASIHCTSGAWDLVVTVNLPDLMELDRYIDERIVSVPGVTGSEAHHVRKIYQDASDWSFHSLSAPQVAAVRSALPAASVRPHPTDLLLDVVAAIGDDVRRPIVDIEKRVGRSFRTVSRAIDTVLVSDWVRWRIDIAHNLAGWFEAMLWLNVPQGQVDAFAADLSRLPRTRLVASTISRSNVVCTLWARDFGAVVDTEALLQRTYPDVRVDDRSLVPRIAKRMGHVIGYDGRLDRYIPYTEDRQLSAAAG